MRATWIAFKSGVGWWILGRVVLPLLSPTFPEDRQLIWTLAAFYKKDDGTLLEPDDGEDNPALRRLLARKPRWEKR